MGGEGKGFLNLFSYLESCRTPVYKLYGPFRLDGGYGRIHVFWHNVSSVEQADSHVLSVSWVTLDHLVGWFETRIGDLGYCQLFMVCLLGRNDRGVSRQRKMDPVKILKNIIFCWLKLIIICIQGDKTLFEIIKKKSRKNHPIKFLLFLHEK